MATTSTTTTSATTTTTKPKRRRYREITISEFNLSNSPSPMTSPSSSPYPSNFTNFNSALNAGLLNPMSPPPNSNPTRSSPTLFEMMSTEPDPRSTPPHPKPLDRTGLLEHRINEILSNRSPGNRFNEPGSGDIKLTVCNKEGFSVSLSVHRHILVGNSKFFAGKLGGNNGYSKRGNNGIGNGNGNATTTFGVDIVDCEDVEVYVETLRLMYCKDLRRKLMREDVSKVLAILKVYFLFTLEIYGFVGNSTHKRLTPCILDKTINLQHVPLQCKTV